MVGNIAGCNQKRRRQAATGLQQQLRCCLELMAPGEALAPERELAAFYGVSYSTVRRVTDLLAQEGLLKKVPGSGLFVAERANGQAAAQGTVVYADPWAVKGNAYFTRCLQGIVETAGAYGLRLRVFRLGAETVQELLAELRRPDVCGLLMPWIHDSVRNILRQERPELRIVTMSARFPQPGVATVMLDFAAMGYQACRYLAGEHGARRPGMVSVNIHTPSGWELGLREFAPGLAATEIMADLRTAAPAAICRKLLAAGVDGVFFDDDRLAVSCLPLLPASLPVVSLANAGEDILPAGVARLTTDAYEVGSGAVHLLGRMLKEARSMTVTSLIQPHLQAPGTRS